MAPLLNTLTKPAVMLGAAAQNALEVARFGGLAIDERPSPYTVHSEHRIFRLRRYHADSMAEDAPPVVLVPPMMLASEIYDVSPQTSAVTTLHEHGADPWVIDFGAPEHQQGGLERNFADHVLAISEAVDAVREETGRDVNLSGYSQGGMFCYQTAAYRRNAGISSLITFGSPVDTRVAMPLGLPKGFAAGAAGVVGERFRGWALPAWASRTGFRLIDPVKSMRSRIEFILQLHDREALLPREGQRRFLEADGWVAWPGPAMADFLSQFVAHNRMLEGGFVVEDVVATLADIECPILSVLGTIDQIAPAASVRAITQAAPRADVYELALRAGHFGLVVGSTATLTTWPAVAGWARWRASAGELPAGLEPVSARGAIEAATSMEVSKRLGYGLELAGGVSAGIARSATRTARRTAASVREIGREAAGQLPRLMRLEQVQPGTRISLGLLVEERRRRTGEDIFFMFGDRAYSAKDINERIDNVVLGLISIGVRQGEHIGVLMGTRPTSLALVIAINRIGAVAVLLRPDGDVQREAQLGQVQRIIADPERAPLAAGLGTVHAFLLGGGGGPRDIGIPLKSDMEQIDVEGVVLPAWYEPNPGRARDLAFIVFTGEGAGTRVNRINNGRWVMSAFGTASSAALSSADTVYSGTPLYHQSALMMSVGGAIAGGARLAMATSFDAATFWDEARRYGVTVASYTWTMLHDLVKAPQHPGERHHSVRLFIGSGMPRGLWRRVQQRFKPARVLEFYAATEAGAILVNLSGAKIGCAGRPLPGSAEIALVTYDLELGGLVLGPDGYALPVPTGEAGMLLARARGGQHPAATPLRGVFERGDWWLQTGDMFRRDADGEYWFLSSVNDVIRTAGGHVFAGPIRDALGVLPAVDLAVAYGVKPDGAEHEIAIGAVTLRPGERLQARDLTGTLSSLPGGQRPTLVHVVDGIPVTTWFRPITGPLREAGVPEPAPGVLIWQLDDAGERYGPMSK
ncbi:MAG: AMP-binding protein [Solirubrobacteraceae bacterium]